MINDAGLEERLIRAKRFLAALPHCSVLRMSIEALDDDGLHVLLPWQEAIIGNPVTGAVHGGSLTTLMDTACGTAAVIALPGFELCPTLDLRVDYMKSAVAGQDLMAIAKVTRIASQVVFTEARVVQVDDGELIARCTGTFMRIGAYMDGHAPEAIDVQGEDE